MKKYFPKILITGSNGQLAQAVLSIAREQPFRLTPCSKNEVNITEITSVQKAIKKYEPDFIINTAAFTTVDNAEISSDLAMDTNYLGIKNLAQCSNRQKIPLLHISTDYVFDGNKPEPYKETDTPNPLNTYGLTKLLGEKALEENHDQYIILRVSGVFSEYNSNFVKAILRLAKERNEFNVITNQITCPTYAIDIATTLFAIIKKINKYGIYHYCNNPPVSWFDFANTILNFCRKYNYFLSTIINPIESKEYKSLAIRPKFSVLDCSKIKDDYGICQSNWEDNIKIVIKKLLMKETPMIQPDNHIPI